MVFKSLEANRLAVVLGTNLARVPYRWASIDLQQDDAAIGYRSRRLLPPHRGVTTNFGVTRTSTDMSDAPLSQFLTARWGLHTTLAGRLLYVPNVHRRWTLTDATVTHCSDELVAAAGLPGVTAREPDSALYADNVTTQFGRPYTVGVGPSVGG